MHAARSVVVIIVGRSDGMARDALVILAVLAAIWLACWLAERWLSRRGGR